MVKWAPCLRLLILLAPAVLLAGCGGGDAPGGPSGVGAVKLHLTWPAGSKLIPASSTAVKVKLFSEIAFGPVSPAAAIRQLEQTVLIPRPVGGGPSETTLTCPVGDYDLEISAHGASDGSDPAQAFAVTNSFAVSLNQTTTQNVTLAGTVVRIEFDTASVILTGLGDTARLTVTAYDANDQVVLLSPQAANWALDANAARAMTIDGSGLVTAIASSGGGRIGFYDSEQDVVSTGTALVVVGGF